MSTSSPGDKVLTFSVVLATVAVLGWAKVKWLQRWWDAVNRP
jgi:hypothetical protein